MTKNAVFFLLQCCSCVCVEFYDFMCLCVCSTMQCIVLCNSVFYVLSTSLIKEFLHFCYNQESNFLNSCFETCIFVRYSVFSITESCLQSI